MVIALFRSYLAEKRFSDARQIAKKLDENNTDSPQGANLIALTYLAEDQSEKAKSQLQETLKRFPADFSTSNNLAKVYIRENNLADARNLYEKVLKNSQDMAIISSELNTVGHCISELIGIVSPDDVLHNIFNNFCIGK